MSKVWCCNLCGFMKTYSALVLEIGRPWSFTSFFSKHNLGILFLDLQIFSGESWHRVSSRDLVCAGWLVFLEYKLLWENCRASSCSFFEVWLIVWNFSVGFLCSICSWMLLCFWIWLWFSRTGILWVELPSFTDFLGLISRSSLLDTLSSRHFWFDFLVGFGYVLGPLFWFYSWLYIYFLFVLVFCLLEACS